MSEQATISRRSGYTAIPNHIHADDRLSLEARGFLALIMSMKEGWVFRRSNLMKTANIGRDKYRRIIRELQDAGYLEIRNTHKGDGTFGGTEWIITDDPQAQDVDTEGLKTRPPATEGLKNPLSAEPAGGETRPLKNNNSNKKPNYKTPPTPQGGRGRSFGVSDEVQKLLGLGEQT